MKIFLKLGLLASTLMTAVSAYAITGDQIVSLEQTRVATVPEPTALGLLAVGVVALALVRRKK